MGKQLPVSFHPGYRGRLGIDRMSRSEYLRVVVDQKAT